MKILVTARMLDPDMTSEGICTAKFVQMMAERHEVTCLTSDPYVAERGDAFALPWLPGVRVGHVDAWATPGFRRRLHAAVERGKGGGRLARYVVRKVDAAAVYATGYTASAMDLVANWETALEALTVADRPDLIMVRGAGDGFEPHIAMLSRKSPVPWVAHYHDPYPASLYPQPYRYTRPIISRHRERVHRAILDSANLLSFPSRRLLEWVLQGRFETHRSKAVVIPHLASELSERCRASLSLPDLPGDGPGRFVVMHTGTFLGPRKPWALLEGFERFLGEDGERRASARLVLLGGVNRNHLADPRWDEALSSPNVLFPASSRVPYRTAVDLARRATVLVVVEASAASSPFFPAKLADYLWLRKPVLALSPRASTVADILGADYPLLVRPDAPEEVAAALGRAWGCWKSGAIDRLVPPEAVLDAIREGAVGDQTDAAFVGLASGCDHRLPSSALGTAHP
jgi:glycosyltransferase involved in cell wall biosynthesis